MAQPCTAVPRTDAWSARRTLSWPPARRESTTGCSTTSPTRSRARRSPPHWTRSSKVSATPFPSLASARRDHELRRGEDSSRVERRGPARPAMGGGGNASWLRLFRLARYRGPLFVLGAPGQLARLLPRPEVCFAENCVVFDNDDENKLAYTEVHQVRACVRADSPRILRRALRARRSALGPPASPRAVRSSGLLTGY